MRLPIGDADALRAIMEKAGGWSAAPGSKKGAQRQPDGKGGFNYRYPDGKGGYRSTKPKGSGKAVVLPASMNADQAIYEAVMAHINAHGGVPGDITEVGMRSRIKTRISRTRRKDVVTTKFVMPEQEGIPAFSVKIVKPREQAEADEKKVREQRETFREMQISKNPLSDADIAKLIQKEPERWAQFRGLGAEHQWHGKARARHLAKKSGRGFGGREQLAKARSGGWSAIPSGKHGGQRKRSGKGYSYRYPDGKGGWQAGAGRRTETSKPKKNIRGRLEDHRFRKIEDYKIRREKERKEEASKRLQATLDKMKAEKPTYKPNQPFDFAGYEDYAARLPSESIRGALRDIMSTLKNADAIDREMGTDNGGRYRDQASVFRRELKLRRDKPAREKQNELKQVEVERIAVRDRMAAHLEDNKRSDGFTTPESNRQYAQDEKRRRELHTKSANLRKEIAAIKKKPKITAADTPEFAEPQRAPTERADLMPSQVKALSMIARLDSVPSSYFKNKMVTDFLKEHGLISGNMGNLVIEEKGRAVLAKGVAYTVPLKRFTVPKVGKGCGTPEVLAKGGWMPIPGGKKGGRRRRKGKGFEYDYSGETGGSKGVQPKPKKRSVKTISAEIKSTELQVQHAENEGARGEASKKLRKLWRELARTGAGYKPKGTARKPRVKKDPARFVNPSQGKGPGGGDDRATVPVPPGAVDIPNPAAMGFAEMQRLAAERDDLKRQLAAVTRKSMGDPLRARLAVVEWELRDLLKAGGWGSIPSGKKGGQRKRVGTRWVYRYPDGKGGWKSGTGGKSKSSSAKQMGLDFSGPEKKKKPVDITPPLVGEVKRIAAKLLKPGDVLRPFGEAAFRIIALGKGQKQHGGKIHIQTMNTEDGKPWSIEVKPDDQVWAQQVNPEAQPKSPEENAPAGTPRGDAQKTTRELKEGGEYVNARASKFQNVGDDLKGSARHRALAWKSLREALDDEHNADEMFTRKFLENEKPIDFIGNAQKGGGDEAQDYLTLYFSMRKFPATIPKGVSARTYYSRIRYVENKAREKALYDQNRHFDPHMDGMMGWDDLGDEQRAKYAKDAQREDREGYYKAFNTVRDAINVVVLDIAAGKPIFAGNPKLVVTDMIRKRMNEFSYSERRSSVEYETLRKAFNGMVGHGKTTPGKQSFRVLKEMEAQNPDDPQGVIEGFKEAALKIMEGKSVNAVLGQKKDRKKGLEASDFYDTDVMKRTGPPSKYRDANKAEKALSKGGAFKIRGLQYGNSMPDQERAHHLRSVADSFDDLGFVTGLPTKMIGYNGKLGMALGARGRAGALAHYEGYNPSNPEGSNVINLTRASGAGSLAHEWGHFFDFEVGRAEVKEGLASGNRWGGSPMSERHLRDPGTGKTAQAMTDLRMSEGWKQFTNRLSGVIRKQYPGMSDKKRQYWQSHKEVFARSFERHVQRKLETSGRENTYLVALRKSEANENSLWPTDEEVDKMGGHFQAIFDQLKETGLMEKMLRWDDELQKAQFTVPRKRFVVGAA